MNIDDCRRFYADEIRFSAGLRAQALVEAFARVPREKFLGSGPWELGSPDARGMSALGATQMSYLTVGDPRQLYHNVLVALDKAANINNGQPGALARWIEALDLKPGNRVYHLGCGVGYYTAILAELVGSKGSVIASEINPQLSQRASSNLSSYPYVTVHSGDGAAFDPGSCDAMLVNAGVTHPLPLWLDRLREGGRLVVPLTMSVTSNLGVGLMVKIVREGDHFPAQIVTPLAIYSCIGARDQEREPVLKAAFSNGMLMSMKSVRRDAHELSDTCLVHGTDVCVSKREFVRPSDKSDTEARSESSAGRGHPS
jgi:protein-L-isoaspartate(D-aspartate) O-methyltransferase